MRMMKLVSDESGQGLIEYSLILSLILVAIIGSIFILGLSLVALYERINVNVGNVM